MESNQIQKGLITLLESLTPTHISLSDTLADLLDISKDSAYRRIRCEKQIDIEELWLICKHFKISMDNVLGAHSNSVVFNYNPIRNIAEFKFYLQSIINDLINLSKFEDVRIVYAAQDMPLFHNFRYAHLTRFKLFYWLRSIVNAEELQNAKFSSDLIDPELIELGEKLYNIYAQVPSEEIWTEITPVSLFKQIDFCWSSGLFDSKESALAVCSDVEQEFNDIEQQAGSGIKTKSDNKPVGFKRNFNLYISEIEIGNNCILTQIGQNKVVYLTYNTFNKISTANPAFSDDINNWLTNLIRKSTPISEVSEKYRYQFFRKLHKELEILRNRIISEL